MTEPARTRGAATAPRALVVDDDASLGRVTARVLERIGFAVATSQSGPEALDRIRRGERFDLVVSDVMMPKLDGAGFHEAARSLWPQIDAALVFVTGGGNVETLQRLRRPCFQKPLDPSFFAHVRGVRKRWEGEDDS
jgi:CheY-like chemotaxis protein